MKSIEEATVGLMCMFICALPLVAVAVLAAVLGLSGAGAVALVVLVLCVIRLHSGRV